ADASNALTTCLRPRAVSRRKAPHHLGSLCAMVLLTPPHLAPLGSSATIICHALRPLRGSDQTLADRCLSGSLSVAAHGFGGFPHPLFRWLLVVLALLHLAEDAFALHPLLQDPEGLVN